MCKSSSEDKPLQTPLQSAREVESLGLIMCGLAHDLNNLLTIICGYTELANSLMEPAEPTQRHLDSILAAAELAASLTRQMLSVARTQVLPPQTFAVNDLVYKVEGLLKLFLNDSIRLVTRLQRDLWPVSMNPGPLVQVLLNLLLNARDAMPEGGQLTVETQNVFLDLDTVVGYGDIEPGEYVVLTVSDTGVGIDEQVRKRLFEPFFTTKEPGKGTGLGLATLGEIIRKHRGFIRLESTVGQGTVISVYLPVPTARSGVE